MATDSGHITKADKLIIYMDAANSRSYTIGSTSCNCLVSTVSGTLEGGTSFSPEYKGGWTFDGTNDYLNLGDRTKINPALDSFTCNVFFKIDTSSTSSNIIASKGNGSSGLIGWLIYYSNANGVLTVRCNGNNTISERAAQYIPINKGQNYMVTMVINRTDNTIKGYLNGSNVGWVNGNYTQSFTGNSISGFGSITNSDDFLIGESPQLNLPMIGTIYLFQTYNIALSESQVYDNFRFFGGRYDLSVPIPPDTLFRMTVDTTAAGGATPADQFEIRLHNGTTNFTVYWGDGNSDVITSYNQAELTHTYAVGGTYQISIDGSLHGFFFQYRDDGKIMSIDNWGTNVWGNFGRSFQFCSNMVANYTDTPDTSAVIDFGNAFASCTLWNGSVDGWDTSSATNMTGMFWLATAFNQPIAFDTSSVTTMVSMFKQASSFNQPINFDGSSLTDPSYMFVSAIAMNSPVTITNSTNMTTCIGMFAQMNSFNSDITLTTTNVTTMQVMFSYSTLFNGTITFNGGTGNVTNMSSMFVYAADFNQPLTFLNDTSNVTNMHSMFRGANEFNQSVSGLNTSSVTSMNSMFRDTWAFNQPVPFDTSSVTNMGLMFFSALQFNQAINFTTTSLTNLMMTFLNASQLISVTLSDTSNVTTMQGMFQQTGTVNQDISSWDITSLTSAANMFNGNTGFSQANYDLMLVAWNAFGTNNVPFHAGTAQYTAPVSAPDTARTAMISRGWTITDGGPA